MVEDDWFVRDHLINVLEDHGWNVMAVASGEEALVLLHPPVGIDVVFTDIQLAGSTTGWDVGSAAETAGGLPVSILPARCPPTLEVIGVFSQSLMTRLLSRKRAGSQSFISSQSDTCWAGFGQT